MSRSIDEILTTLENLSESWKTLGHPTQAKVQAEALSDLRALLVERTEGKRRR